MSQRRARVRQVLEVRRSAPVLQVGEVGDKGGLGQEFLRREVVEVEWVRERLDKLPANVSITSLKYSQTSEQRQFLYRDGATYL